MKEKLAESQFSEVYFEPNLSLVSLCWKAETENMTNEGYRENVLVYQDFMVKKAPRFVIIDTRSLYFQADEELQRWTVEVGLPIFLEAEVEKVAILMPPDLLTAMSVEQTIEESERTAKAENYSGMHLIRYFEDEEGAKDWFNFD